MWTSLTGSSTAGGQTMVFDRRQRLALTAHDASCLPDDAVPIAERSPARQQTQPNRTGPKSPPTPGVSRKTGSVVRPGEGGLTGILDR